MLGLLIRYAEEKGLAAEPGFIAKHVRWAVQLGGDGRFLGVVELGDVGEKRNRGRSFGRVPELSQGEIKRGGSGCRHFLVDNVDVIALLSGDDDQKLLAKHAFFVDLLRRAGSEIPSPPLALAAQALADPGKLARIGADLTAAGARPTDNATFFVDGTFPVESDTWHPWWRAFRRGLAGEPSTAAGEGGGKMRCFASGELVSPALTHPKIKGLADVGGLATGDVLASFKQDSFRSYGLVQSENAAVSEAMAATYRAALNHLLEHSSYRLGEGVRVLYWYQGADVSAAEDLFAALLGESAEESREVDARLRAGQLLMAIEEGKRPDLLRARFVVWTVSGASGRIMVRDFAEGRFEDLARTVHRWFDDLAIVDRGGEGLARAPKFWAVVGTLAREKLSDVPAPTVSELWRTALHPDRFPESVAAQVLHRVRSEIVKGESLRAHRFGVLKAFVIRQRKDQWMKPGLSPDHPEPAYQCGRLMAALAYLQWKALGDVGAGVVQRYYAAASATPGLVLGRLVRTSQFHLDKLEGGLRQWHQGRLAEIASRIAGDFPQTLDLHGQSLFALGYYHQVAEDRRKKTDGPAATPNLDLQEGTTDA